MAITHKFFILVVTLSKPNYFVIHDGICFFTMKAAQYLIKHTGSSTLKVMRIENI